jgi:hypothetical protein
MKRLLLFLALVISAIHSVGACTNENLPAYSHNQNEKVENSLQLIRVNVGPLPEPFDKCEILFPGRYVITAPQNGTICPLTPELNMTTPGAFYPLEFNNNNKESFLGENGIIKFSFYTPLHKNPYEQIIFNCYQSPLQIPSPGEEANNDVKKTNTFELKINFIAGKKKELEVDTIIAFNPL